MEIGTPYSCIVAHANYEFPTSPGRASSPVTIAEAVTDEEAVIFKRAEKSNCMNIDTSHDLAVLVTYT